MEENNIPDSPQYHPSPSTPATLYVNNEPVISKVKKTLRNAATTQSLRRYLQQRNQWPDKAIENLDWEILATTIKQYKFADRRRIQKMMYSWLPTGRRLHREDNNQTIMCPTCKGREETTSHIFTCRTTKRKAIHDEFTKQLLRFFDRTKTDPKLVDLINAAREMPWTKISTCN